MAVATCLATPMGVPMGVAGRLAQAKPGGHPTSQCRP